jgi:hypothetical protein
LPSGWLILSALAVRPLPSIMTAATALATARPAAMNIASLNPARNDAWMACSSLSACGERSRLCTLASTLPEA